MSDLRTDDLRELSAALLASAPRYGISEDECASITAAADEIDRLWQSLTDQQASGWSLSEEVQALRTRNEELWAEVQRLRELVDVLKSVPGSSIVLSKDEYAALTAAIESPPEPTPALRNLMAEGEWGA